MGLINSFSARFPSLSELALQKVHESPISETIESLEGLAKIPPTIELDNGMKILIQDRPEPNTQEGVVSLRLVVRVGSQSEGEENKQMAHFVEHSVCQGSKKYSWKRIQEVLAQLGCCFGSEDFGAETYPLQTRYFLKNISIAEIEMALDLLYHMIFKSTFPCGRIENERSLIQLEVKPLEEKYNQKVHTNFNDEVLKLKGRSLQQRLILFHKKWYVPNNMYLIIIGNFTDSGFEEKLHSMEAKIRGSFGLQQKGDIPVVAPFDRRPSSAPAFAVSVLALEPNSSLRIIIERQETPKTIYEFEALRTARRIIELALMKKFSPLVADPKQGIKSFSASLALPRQRERVPDYLQLGFCTVNNKMTENFEFLLDVIKQFVVFGIEKSELELFSKRVEDERNREHHLLLQNNSEILAEIAGSYEITNHFQDPAVSFAARQIFLTSPHFLTDFQGYLNSELNFCSPLLQKNFHVLGAVTTHAERKVALAEMEKIYTRKKSEEACLKGCIESVVPEKVLPLSIVEPIEVAPIESLKCIRLKFSNTLLAYLHPIEGGDPTVFVRLITPKGIVSCGNRKEAIASYLGLRMLGKMGAFGSEKLDPDHLLMGTTSNLIQDPFTPKMDSDCWWLNFTCFDARGIEAALKIIYANLADREFLYSEEFAIVYEAACVALKRESEASRSSEKGEVLAHALKELHGNHEMIMPITGEDLLQINIDDCRKALGRLLQEIEGASLVISGPFEVSHVSPLVKQYIGNLRPIAFEPPNSTWSAVVPSQHSAEQELPFGRHLGFVRTYTYTSLPPMDYQTREKFKVSIQTLLAYLNMFVKLEKQDAYTYSMLVDFWGAKDTQFNRVATELFVLSSRDDKANKNINTYLDEFFKSSTPPAEFCEFARQYDAMRKKNAKLKIRSASAFLEMIIDLVRYNLTPEEISAQAAWENEHDAAEEFLLLKEVLLDRPQLKCRVEFPQWSIKPLENAPRPIRKNPPTKRKKD